MLTLVILLYCTGKIVTATEQCDAYQFSTPLYPGESCKDIYNGNPQTHNRSGYYWLINPPRHVYCDMEQRVVCGNIGGWTRIASVNITGGDECPTGRSQDGISFCRSLSDNAGCYPIIFSSKGISYQKVCGMARGYQKGSPGAFTTSTQLTVEGIFITHGGPHRHIWSFIAGVYDVSPEIHPASNCPCATNPGAGPTAFVGSNYFCESGVNSGEYKDDVYYLSDPLWDGLDCPTGNTCCDNPNLPWFYRELDMAIIDDVEVSMCTDEEYSNEGILVDQLELYIL